ncbi:MAG: PspA/IM30 family protein [Candidatus Thiodiazotropha sp. (ex Monitilora ramsayi)]|nr:PspA/IM30 family protein [Candidatus Thiodiazotropha sp. (ex Monitilora ramsayi)]
MSFLKRLSVSVRSQLDEAVSRIENHDAVIDAALQESRDAIARLKLQQSRMSKKTQSIDAQIDKLQTDEQSWVRRAKMLAKGDEAQALACLDRRDRCVEQIKQLQAQREQCTELEFRLANNLTQLEQKLIDDEQRLQEFRGRDLSAKAEHAIEEIRGSGSGSLEQAFDRWELDITRKELRQDAADPASIGIDSLEERFQREERLEAQKAELKALMGDES